MYLPERRAIATSNHASEEGGEPGDYRVVWRSRVDHILYGYDHILSVRDIFTP